MHLCRYPQFLQPPRPIMMEFTIIGPIYHNHEPKTKAIEKKIISSSYSGFDLNPTRQNAALNASELRFSL